MARFIDDNRLRSRSARLPLKIRSTPYWRVLEPGLALGYRRGIKGGIWFARRYLDARSYERHRIGIADDRTDADGVTVLSYADAITAARSWWLVAKNPIGDRIDDTKYTVSSALDDYIAYLKAKGSRDVEGAKGKIEAHIRPALGTEIVSKLTARRLMEFQACLAEKPRLGRSGKPVKPAKVLQGDPLNARRARQATANRTMTTLKAALNHSFHSGRVASDLSWRRVKPFRNTDVARIRWLTREQIRTLDSHLDDNFRPLARGALTTGARYSELTLLRVHDFDGASGTIYLRNTKSGKHRTIYLNDEGKKVFMAAADGKSPSDYVFTKGNGKPWKTAEQARPLKRACKAAGISPPVSFHALRHSFGSLLAQNGVPMKVIAEALGHADTRITEKHYAHLSATFVANAIRRGLPFMALPFDDVNV